MCFSLRSCICCLEIYWAACGIVIDVGSVRKSFADIENELYQSEINFGGFLLFFSAC